MGEVLRKCGGGVVVGEVENIPFHLSANLRSRWTAKLAAGGGPGESCGRRHRRKDEAREERNTPESPKAPPKKRKGYTIQMVVIIPTEP